MLCILDILFVRGIQLERSTGKCLSALARPVVKLYLVRIYLENIKFVYVKVVLFVNLVFLCYHTMCA